MGNFYTNQVIYFLTKIKKAFLGVTYNIFPNINELKTLVNKLPRKNTSFLNNFFSTKFNKLQLALPTKTYFFIFTNKLTENFNPTLNINYSFYSTMQTYSIFFLRIYKQTLGDGFVYIRGLFLIFFIDACLTDDEPIWEPVEWSLIQSWILFIFAFGWISENLITSRYGSYTGRDKRVWFSWYKMFWVVIFWYILSLGAASLFVITPYYHEVSSLLPLSVSWWDWYTRIFFSKFISLYTIILLIGVFLQINTRVFNWKKIFFLVTIINIFLFYLLYAHFFMSFFMYLTDPNWYSKSRLVDYVQLSHEPRKWSWGSSKRDHFSYHKSTTVFWFKNDGPFASAFLVIHLFFFVGLFGMNFFWVTLLRRIYTTQEVSYTFLTYCVSALKQFYYYFLLIYLFVIFSFIINYFKLPIEFFWSSNSTSWLCNFKEIFYNYPSFLLLILK